MAIKLKPKELCPLHRRRDCCGRQNVTRVRSIGKWEQVRPGVRRIWDEILGKFRYKLSPAERRKVILRKLQANGCTCGICDLPIEDMRDVVADHIAPKGMGGARADDGDFGANLQPAHNRCNMEKGSRR
jgi:5-methylcytosine-specific restriction endonuclease McrA